MIEITRPQQFTRLRRIALNAQGLLKTRPYGNGLEGARKAIEHIGYVQIDTISVVERAHHHTLYSRVPTFLPAMSRQMLLDRDIFEYWTHAAALIPIADFRFSLPYKYAIKNGQIHWYKNPDKKLMREVLARVRAEGPLRSRDLDTNNTKSSGWWDWKPAKKAIEQLYMQGDLMVCDREGFQKSYDLTERILPAHIDSSMPSVDEFASHLVDQQLRCHGLVSLKGFTYLRKNTPLRKAVKALIDEKLAQQTLEQLKVDNGEVFIVEAGTLECPLPRVNNRMHILSPFDNSVIQRERLKCLFQYDYQLECYVPAAKRQYGYFSLPLLYRDQFVGRMDCKVHRKDQHFEIKTLYLENHDIDIDDLIGAWVKATIDFCHFQQCHSIALTHAYPKPIEAKLRQALAAQV